MPTSANAAVGLAGPGRGESDARSAGRVSAPNNLAGVLNSGDLTALVQIKARHYEVRASSGNAKDPVTRYEGVVLESLRDQARRPGGTGQSIDLIQSGGFMDTPEGVIEYVDKTFSRLRPGLRVLLILEWSGYYNAYRFYFGPDSSFELDELSGRVRTQGQTAVSRAQLDVPVQAFLARARQLVRR